MSFSIGPILFTFLEAHSWDARRQVEIVNVPFARQTGFSVGAELTSYQLTGAFYADTDAAAKVLRRQINELFSNPDMDFEYIGFDGDDDEELSGWFLLDQVSTSILPGVFGDYPFTASVRRLGNIQNARLGGYWKSNPFDNDYGLIGREWMAVPNDLGSTSVGRDGEGGRNAIIALPVANPVIYQNGDPQFPDYYDMRCRLIETSAITPSSETWLEIYGKDHKTETDGASYMISNGLIALDHLQVIGPEKILRGLLYVTSIMGWQVVLTRFRLKNAGGTIYTILHRPIVEKYSYDEIEWSVLYGLSEDDDTFSVKFKLRRGTYFIDVFIPERKTGLDIGSGTALVRGTSFTSSSIAANYAVGIIGDVQMGFLYTETSSPSIVGNEVRLGYTISANSTSRFAILIAPSSLPSGTTLANLGNEYIANVTQQQVLIDPRWT